MTPPARVYQHHHLDSTRWRWFVQRPDDIVITTSYKAGTTWMQTIVAQLLFPDGDVPGVVDGRFPMDGLPRRSVGARAG